MVQKLSSYSEITEDIVKLSEIVVSNMQINPELYTKYEVKRGLRDISGKGVLAGLTNIAEVKSYTIDDGEMIPCEGKLYYHGYDIDEIVKGFVKNKRHGFEETIYLLLFGELPTPEQLKFFNELMVAYRDLPPSFTRDVILKAPSRDMMN
ncbi:MAG: citrate synthase, partial [Oscillospiraceae bacterium]|nr:citrate synthase [Oscillospiraceae bacterium]